MSSRIKGIFKKLPSALNQTEEELKNQSLATLKTKEELADFIEQCIDDEMSSEEKADWIVNMLVGDGLVAIVEDKQ